MTLEQFIVFGATLSGIVASIVESIKYGFLKAWFVKLQTRYQWDDPTANKYYVMTLTVISVAVGILVALGNGPDANLLTQLGYPQVHPVVGIVVTGFFLAFGDQFWHELFNLLKAVSTFGKLKAETESQRALTMQANLPPNWVRPPETK